MVGLGLALFGTIFVFGVGLTVGYMLGCVDEQTYWIDKDREHFEEMRNLF